MTVMLLDTELRSGELVGLTVSTVNLEEGMLRVSGNGNKER